MPARFDDAIPFSGEWVAAIGPEHPKEKIKEICVWIYQSLPGGAGDAAATEMTTHREGEEHGPHFLQIEGDRWLLPLKKISGADFRPGRAFAIGVALIAELEGDERERVVWWSQPVELQEDAGRVAAAVEAVDAAAHLTGDVDLAALAQRTLGRDGPLDEPLEFQGIP